MAGESFLVAPVFQDAPMRDDIYFPAGAWIDYWDGTTINGPTTLNGYAAPLEKLPLFVRAGAIIPMYPEMLYDGERPADPVTLDVYPSGTTRFLLYEDDGDTQQYRSGAFARTLIESEAPATPGAAGDRITVTVHPASGQYDHMPLARAYALDVHVPKRPASVTLGGRSLQEIAPDGPGRQALDRARAAFDAATEGWWFDAGDRRGVLHVKVGSQTLAAGLRVAIGL
jgi:hypothetical protein